jgi:hypothetical protein
MINCILLAGVIGSIILVAGSALPEKAGHHPIESAKNWFLGFGALIMLIYALLNYFFAGGIIFFVFLQGFIVIASIMMMLDTKDKIDILVMLIAGISFIVWSLTLFKGYNTIFFILGFIGIGLGYTLETGTIYRSLALMLGGVLIAIFSYIETNWIFFWLNVFFAVFSGYYTIRILMQK